MNQKPQTEVDDLENIIADIEVNNRLLHTFQSTFIKSSFPRDINEQLSARRNRQYGSLYYKKKVQVMASVLITVIFVPQQNECPRKLLEQISAEVWKPSESPDIMRAGIINIRRRCLKLMELVFNIPDAGFKTEELLDIILYYVMKREQPSLMEHALIILIYDPYLFPPRANSIEDDLESMWFTTCAAILGSSTAFQRLFTYFTSTILETLFRKAPNLIANKFCSRVLDRLTAVLTFEQMHRVLMSQTPEDGHTAMFHLDIHGQKLCIRLYEDHPYELDELLSLEDKNGRAAVHINAPVIAGVLNNILVRLLSLVGTERMTILHSNAEALVNLLTKIELGDSFDKWHKLFMNTAMDRQTIMFIIRKCDVFIKFYAERTDGLYDLLSIQDKQRRTALHVNTAVIIDLLTQTYNTQYFEKLLALVQIKDDCSRKVNLNVDNMEHLFRKVAESDPTELYQLIEIEDSFKGSELDNWLFEIIVTTYSFTSRCKLLYLLRKLEAKHFRTCWLLDQVKKEFYLLYHEPTVLIIYSTKRRPQAEEEAHSIEDAFKSLMYNNTRLKKNKEKGKILQLIRESAEAIKSALIVVLLSHGDSDSIEDCEGQAVRFKEIEDAMCHDMSKKEKPKILIVQCCREKSAYSSTEFRVNTLDVYSDPSRLPRTKLQPEPREPREPREPTDSNQFQPRNEHFYVIWSAVYGQQSARNVFIKYLAQNIQVGEKDRSLGVGRRRAAISMSEAGHRQTPLEYTTLCGKICLANYYDYYIHKIQKKHRIPNFMRQSRV